MNDEKRTGRVTIPTDLDAVPETLALMQRWGADAIRDCDGTEFPAQLRDTRAKVYATYYTTRKDNAWAKANPDEIQQCYIMSPFATAAEGELRIPLMQGLSRELLKVNDRDDIARWWEVVDRTTGQPVPPARWSYAGGSVTVQAEPFHEYTVSFLAYLIWDPVHMYNATTNGWTNFEHQITFDVRQPKTHKYTMERLRKFIADHPYVNVIRYTTFFHQFTLIFDELRREKYVDWYGYSASVSPYILEQFEREVGYPFRPEYIIDQGYHNNQYRVPSKEYKDFMAFQQREVNALVREMTDIVHEYGKEAMMFLGDHWIGTEPFGDVFASSGVDAIVGSVGNGSTLRLISDIPGVKYTEGRFLPYFFPDTAHTGGIWWEDPAVSSAIRRFVWNGGGLIGVGEPGGHQYQGRFLQLAGVLGVEKETGFTLNYDKYNWDEHRGHFILADCPDHDMDFGEGKKSIYALEGTEILIQRDKEVQLAAHDYGQGRGVYISGLPYSFANSRALYRAILWAAHSEDELHAWFSSNYNVEVHAYVKNGKYCVVNNTYEPQDTTVYRGDGSSFELHLDANEIKWYSIA